MSQPDASVAGLLSMDPNCFDQAQLDTLFNTAEIDQTVYSLDNGEAFLAPDFNFGRGSYPTPPFTTAPSSESSPDLADYSFGQNYTDCPTPGPRTPHPYPIEQQQCFSYNIAGSVPTDQRPQVLRSLTNTTYLAPSDAPPGYARRRSLSQGDMDLIATTNAQALNPTFMRLMTPRSRSVTPDQHRGGKHSRSSSRKSNGPRREIQNRPTSIPYLVNDKVSTALNNPSFSEEPVFHPSVAQKQWPVQHGHSGSNNEGQVIIRHMAGLEQMQHSRKIIEIGAMAVTEAFDPRLQWNGSAILRKLEEVEWYLRAKCGKCEEALKGCASIREAVKGKTRMSGDDGR